METQTMKRCAIYARKSLEDSVEKDFNSIDAQREAGEAYVRSQKANGWELLPKRYDDYGFSGGNMNRPALKELLADCEAGQVDVVVIYKIDRLSRSICDFAELSRQFDKLGVSFVAVTQEINTATSAGRMMLNILMTFAQYEREVIAERIRDKFAASRRKGIWMGGRVPLGYRVEKRKLVVVPEEAETVRRIFRRYTEIQSPKQIALELNADGILRDGKKWTTPHIFRLLRQWVYIGKVEYKGAVYDGEQDAIIATDVWETVRRYMEDNDAQVSKARGVDGLAPLKGILRCGCCDCAMTPSFTYKNGRKYCFYICVKDSKRAERECKVRRLSAGDIEGYVFGQLTKMLKLPEMQAAVCSLTGLDPRQANEALGELPTEWMTQGEKQRLAELLLQSVTVYENEVVMEIKTAGMQTLAREAYNENQN